MVTAGGTAALSWEVIWQLKASLALGVSATGAAIILAVTMGGMTVGSLLMGAWLRHREPRYPVCWYGLMEGIIGCSGLALHPLFAWLERIDSATFPQAPEIAPWVYLLGIITILGLPTMAMGATLPLLGLAAKRYQTSIALLYALNTFGAAIGTLYLAFAVLPAFGLWKSALIVSGINISIALMSLVLASGAKFIEGGLQLIKDDHQSTGGNAVAASVGRLAWRAEYIVVFVTGFATFALEVAWFRSIRAVLLSTTVSFALMLAAVLLPLAFAAQFAAYFRKRTASLGTFMAIAGCLILLVTPLVERFDIISQQYFYAVLPSWFVETILVIGIPIFFLGIALPWILDQEHTPRGWSSLYAVNTFGAIAGALLAAWVLLPTVGFARTAWICGTIVVLMSLAISSAKRRALIVSLGALSLVVAVASESGIGRHRILGINLSDGYRVVGFHEGPDSTVSVVEDTAGVRQLYIDGFSASGLGAGTDYMVWMGSLPMLLHPAPKTGLVICFGTGQTANAVRQEGIQQLDIVDISQAVFDMAGHFPPNEDVLHAPGVVPITMDGRAWLRRTDRKYDIITLEPMPPTFAGVNALYCREFYQLMTERLNPGGIVAQWLPFHLVDQRGARAIAATFQTVFPDSILWAHPQCKTGILLGRFQGGEPPLASAWHRLEKEIKGRTLRPQEITQAVWLDRAGMQRYAQNGEVITDDNQLLAYGWCFIPRLVDPHKTAALSHEQVEQAARAK